MPDQPITPPVPEEKPIKPFVIGVPDNVPPEVIDPQPSKPKRKVGAPVGNTNALRHGFYAKNLGNFSPHQYCEVEMRNLLGEAAMLKDYMYFVYNANLGSKDSADLADTLRALSLAGMALSRVLQVHSHIRISTSSGGSHLSALLDQ